MGSWHGISKPCRSLLKIQLIESMLYFPSQGPGIRINTEIFNKRFDAFWCILTTSNNNRPIQTTWTQNGDRVTTWFDLDLWQIAMTPDPLLALQSMV